MNTWSHVHTDIPQLYSNEHTPEEQKWQSLRLRLVIPRAGWQRLVVPLHRTAREHLGLVSVLAPCCGSWQGVWGRACPGGWSGGTALCSEWTMKAWEEAQGGKSSCIRKCFQRCNMRREMEPGRRSSRSVVLTGRSHRDGACTAEPRNAQQVVVVKAPARLVPGTWCSEPRVRMPILSLVKRTVIVLVGHFILKYQNTNKFPWTEFLSGHCHSVL